MMGSSVPTQGELSNLTSLIELVKLAMDSDKASKAIAVLAAERKKYDDAIVEAQNWQRAALQEQAKASQDILNAAAATEQRDRALYEVAEAKAQLELQRAEIQALSDAAEARMAEAQKLEQSTALASARVADQYAAAEVAIGNARKAAAEIEAKAKETLAEAEAMKATWQQKMDQLVALAGA